MTTAIARLRNLDACPESLTWLATQPTLRAAWDACEERGWMTWVVGLAHRKGTMTRKRLVQIAIRYVEPVLHLTTESIAADLGIIAEWTVDRATDAEMRAAADRIYTERRSLWDAAADAADAADAAADAAAAAYAAAYAAADAAAAAYAYCDVIRSAITIDELAAYLGLDPDEALAKVAA